MEIAWVAKQGLRIKGKNATLLVNPLDETAEHDATIYFPFAKISNKYTAVPINGPGEYEVGGVKISGVKQKDQTIYSVTVDGVDILLGDLEAIEKLQHKVKEHNIVLIRTEVENDASFVNGLATNVVILYGDKAKEVLEKFAKEGLQELNKYSSTKDKLPQEIQTILLS